MPLDEVSRAMGHASPATTKRYYDHFIQRSFSDKMMEPVFDLDEGDDDGKVIDLRSRRQSS